MDSFVTKLVGFIIGLLLLTYAGYQAFRFMNSPYRTEMALSTRVSDTVKVQALGLRDETLIEKDYDGVLSYLCEDAAKVSKGMTVAKVYQNETDARNQKKMDAIEAEIEILKDCQNPGGSYSATAAVVGNQITEKLNTLLSVARSGVVEQIDSPKTDLLSLLNRKQIITGEHENFDDRIETLRTQLKEISSRTGDVVDVVNTSKSGYFVTEIDGFEKMIDGTDLLDSMSYADLKNLFFASASGNIGAVGKVIENFRWYLITEMDIEQAKNLNRIGSVWINLNISSKDQVRFTVEKMIENEDKSRAVLILSSDYVSKETCTLRFREVELILANYSGLKVSSSALRYVNDQQGVYVKDKAVVRFKPIEVLYEDNGMLICREGTSADELQLFDEVIVGGKDLYDGKPVE